jgi:hypothetical protein
MRKLLPAIFAFPLLRTASAALPAVDSSGTVFSENSFFGVARFSPLHLTVAIPEPASNVLLVCGLLTIGGLAIFLGRKLG